MVCMLGKSSIFLIGPMGSGKTAVGRHLARLFRYVFHDSDADIEARTGVDIPLIFDKEGEAGFRAREKESIERLTSLEGVVLATGGGAVIDAGNRRLLQSRGIVVYLATSVGQQLERTRQGRQRPLLYGADPEAKLAELMERRAALYARDRRPDRVNRRAPGASGGRRDPRGADPRPARRSSGPGSPVS